VAVQELPDCAKRRAMQFLGALHRPKSCSKLLVEQFYVITNDFKAAAL
jgi:hypothetical protein